MGPNIFIKKIKDSGLANGEVAYAITLFRHQIILTEEEAKKLLVYLFDAIVAGVSE